MSEQNILVYTPVNEIPGKVARLKKSFAEGKLSNVDFRLDQLRNLYFAIKDNEDAFKEAIRLDLNKPPQEFELQELNVVEGELLEIINSLKSWVKPQSVTPSFLFKFSGPKIIKTPIGVVLVIGAFNFPLNLNVQPVVAAIAAGNPVLLKQSELVPHTTSLLTKVLTEALDPDIFQIVDGAVEETTAVLNEKFDKIIYTGGGVVGTIVAKKAAETLTPVILELGGKSPAFVTEHCNYVSLAAKKIAVAKNSNAGQICITTDYALVHESKYDEFIKEIVEITNKVYGNSEGGKNYGKIVHDRAFNRLAGVLKDTKGEIIYQNGEADQSKRFFPSTIVKDVTFEDSLMKDELFGPILPIIKYKNLDDAISKVVKYHDTPLAMYLFTPNKREEEYIISRIRSGSVLVNETIYHAAIPVLPFGGIGTSGTGNYHGIHGFNAFSHDRAFLRQPTWTESLFEAAVPPISNFDMKITKYFLVPAENINRKGRVFKRNILFYTIVAAAAAIGSYWGFNSSGNRARIGI